ncbi:MAG: gliding motility-associated C-terminal domain-containing protein [Bacteroidetes bacterium]|nr:gliding motility-associated C-terminal domain-containing protein [Bacteroidota bacterium]
MRHQHPNQNRILRSVYLLLMILLSSGINNQIMATHAAGSDIKYRCLGGMLYEIEVTFYRDCDGVSEPSTITINCKSASGNHNLNITANKVAGSSNGVEITVPCATSNSTCNGGSSTGVRKWTYRATVTLPSARADWVFSYSVCCRNCTITTISNPCASNSTLYVEAKLNNILAPCNSSPTFSNIPIAFVCAGQNFNYNHGVLDPDGDSLVYSLITPKTTATATVNFVAPATVNTPIASSTPFLINATTGDLNFTPSQTQIGIMAILVQEYRNNQLIGSVIRDMQIYTNVCVNNLPTASGINGTTNFTMNACPNQQICFTVNSIDIDASQIVSLTTNNGISNATYTIGTGNRPTLTFCWTPTTANISLRPHTFTVTVRDNACPTNGIQTYSFNIYVPQPNFITSSTNINCNGGATGTASAFPVYSGTYNYLWSNGATTSSINGLTAGTYSVTATDPGSGCSVSQAVVITEPSGMNATAVATQPSCTGVANGAIDASVTGGNTPYTYNWSNGSTTQDLNSLPAGTYTLTITDANGCTKTSTTTLAGTYLVGLTTTPTAVSCFGNASGAIASTPANGVAPYSYAWSNGASSSGLNNINAGVYTLTVTDANGCKATSSATITQPSAALSLTASALPVNCFGQSTGSVSVNASGGTAPYTYLWSNGATTSSLNNIPTGTYTVTVTDSKGCTSTLNRSVNQPLAALTTGASQTNVNCFGQSTGAISVTVSGGTTPYTYLWNNGAQTQNINSLSAGIYSVTVTDAVGCTSVISRTITQPTATLTASTSSTNAVSCFGGSNGSIALNINGGTTPYSYNWNTGATTQNLSGLSAGNYSVTVTDANNCTSAVSSISITQPTAALNATSAKVNVACFGNASGSVNITTIGGTSPYTYQWNNGASSQNISGLSAGTYTVTVTDAQNCITNASVNISQPAAAVSLSTTKTNVRCFGSITGLATAIGSGGTSPYTYIWSNGANTSSINNLTAGTYTVTITDANGCTSATPVSITQPAAALAISANTTNISCRNVPTGTITTNVTGGTSPYSYQWNNGMSTSSLNNLSSGSYTVTVTDAQGCTINNTYTLSQPNAILSATLTGNAVGCFGNSTGSATVVANGGTTPYTYQWNTGSTASSISNASAGSYSVTITDANGCTVNGNTAITQPIGALSLSTTSTNVACFGNSSGSAVVTPTGGTTPYTYIWSNGISTQGASSLAAGNYSVTVTDANGCTSNSAVNIQQPSATLQASATSNDINCTGNSIGSIDVTVNGGTSPYSYLWSNGSGQQDITNLSANTYTVTVTDANGCTFQLSKTVSQPAGALNVNSSVTNLLCHDDNNGIINITASAGTPPYTYSWSTGSTSEDINNLSAGSYTVTVSDNNGCTLTNNLFVTQPSAPLAASISNVPVACFGNSTASLNLSVTGGTSGYTFAWSNGNTNEDQSNISAGNYSVIITDQNGCTTSAQTSIAQPAAPLSLSATQVNLNCHDVLDGSIQAVVAGGTSGYTYLWSNGETNSTISNLPVGAYTLTVTDANGCTSSQSYTINHAAAILTANIVSAAVPCFGDPTGSLNLNISGGTPPFLYKWNTGQTSEDLNNMNAGSYMVTITDANGCSTSAIAVIAQPIAALSSSQTTTPVLCFGDATGLIDFNSNGGTQPYSYSWSNGSTSEDLLQLTAGDYTITVTDANGCTLLNTISITQPSAPIQSNFTVSNAACYGDSSGSIQTVINGGTAPYTYNWSNQSSNQDIQSLPTGSYQLVVTDANGCVLTENVSVSQPLAPISTAPTLVNIDCNGNGTGSADLQTSGGTAPYTYQWSNGTSQMQATGLQSGTYTYTVTDANQCIFSGNVTITQPAASLTVTNQMTSVGCFGNATGMIDLSVSGGTPSYSYLWNDGSTTEDLNNLVAGTYTVTVTDNNNCLSSQSFTIDQPLATLALTDSIAMVNCFAGQDATVQVYVNGGTAPYTYSWNDGSTNSSLSNISIGTYSVMVTDVNGCTINNSYTITQPSAALANSTVTTAALCYGDSTGSIDISVTGGTTPYTYLWNNGASTEDLSNISSGTYTVIITDANNCTSTETINIAQPAAVLSATPTVNQVMCTGDSSGAVSLSVSGGTGPYNYLWNTGATLQNPTGMPAGNYNVTVTDANGCSTLETISIAEPAAALQLNASVGHLNCHAQPTGWIDITVTGGTGTYSYLWNTGGTVEDPSQLLAGNYTVTVTDQNGCSSQINAQITQPAAFPTVSAVTIPVSCTGMQNGAVYTVVRGGTSPYSYQWNTGATTDSLTAIGAGTYIVTVTDANGCSESYTTQIIEPVSSLNVTGNASGADCITGQLGTLSVATTGGTAPYTYLWNTGANTSTLSNQIPGTYTVTVADANGCESLQSLIVSDISDLNIAAVGDPEICMGQTAIIRTDTIPNATLQWYYNGALLQGATLNSFVTPVAGTYTLTATTVCGTYTSNPVVVTVRVLNNVSINNSVIVCKGESTQLQAGGGVEYSWSPTLGLNNATISNPVATPVQTTDYTVTIKDEFGCTATATVTVSVICDTLDIPNGFSPNNDGTNDTFVIDGIDGYPGNVLFIYNRWGNLVYKKKEYANEWDGRANVNGVMFGEELPNGTYYYILDLNVDQKPFNGFVVIRR